MSEGWFTIIGVFIGFGLSELTILIRAFLKTRRLKVALIEELSSIIQMLPSKVSILEHGMQQYQGGHVLPLASTHFPHQVYDQVLLSAPTLLTQIERDCLHTAYERLRVVDVTMDSTEERFNSITVAHSSLHASKATVGLLSDLIDSLNNTRNIIQSVLDKKPIEVYKKDVAS